MKLEPKQTVVEKYGQKVEIEFYSKFAMEHGLSKEEEALRCFMWVDVVRMLSNNPKSEEKGGTNMALNPKKKNEKCW